MNDNQHDAYNRLTRARSQVKLTTYAQRAAKREERAAAKALREAVARNPESWYGTPGVTDEPTVLRRRA